MLAELLERTWAALAPAFASGQSQAAAWRAAESLTVPPLAPLSRDALRVWGVDAAGEAAIRATCASFVRVSPVNLMLSGLLRRLLTGERPPGTGRVPSRLEDAATRAACQRLLAAVDAEIPAVFAALPSPPAAPPTPPAREFADVVSALDTYRQTSPEMVVVGRMLSAALPMRARD